MLNENLIKTIEQAAPVVGLITLAVVIAAGLLFLILQIVEYYRLLQSPAVFLELTPPAKKNKSREATQRLFTVLHGLRASRSITDRLLARKVAFSLEITASRDAGIRYLARVSSMDVESFEQAIASYMPDVKVRRVQETEKFESRYMRVLETKQTGHFAYPLRSEETYDEHDPMAYLTGAMTNLQPGEFMSLQIIVHPVNVREASVIAKRLLHNEELLHQLGRRRMPLIGSVLSGISSLLFGALDTLGEGVSSTKPRYDSQRSLAQHKQQVAMNIKPARVLSAFEQDLAEAVYDKLNQPLFRADVRMLLVTKTKQDEKHRSKSVRDWLALFAVPKYQSLKVRLNTPLKLVNKCRLAKFDHRLPSLFTNKSSLLSAAELTDLYHFPHTENARTVNVAKSLSKTLPAPISLKNGTALDVVLGRNVHHGVITDIGLTAAERERHAFIVGGTGNGKTTLLKYGIVQDIQNGKGVAVIDPHGDLAQELLSHIPKDRIKDVIYFNPADLGYPIGLNLLELPEGLSDDQLLDAKDFIAETVVSIMRKTFSDDGSGGHRIEYVLRNAVLTALTVKDATLFTVYDLLTDKDFRKPIVKKLEQEWLRNFWDHEFGKAGDYQQVKMMSGVTSKIGRYHASVSAERILSQPKSTIDFGDILDGKILICNLAKGLVGEDTSEVLGISILAKLQLASFQRIKQKRAARRPFYAYVDEFQNFATTSFVEMLSESRKYKLFLVMAEQTTSQQNDAKMVNTILTNAGTIICFKSNSLADEQQMLHLFNGKVDSGEISNLPAYNFYAKLSGGLEPQDPVSGMTIVLDEDGDESIAEAVIAASRKNYTKKFVAEKKAKDGKTSAKESKDDDQSEQLMTNSEG